MQLNKLYSNQKGFHTVNFKEGVNLVIGEATKENADNMQKTVNGVGKSLLIKLIDFCLSCDPIEDFETKLPEWEFSLEFEHDGKSYISTRSTSNQKKIKLNGEEISVDDFRTRFGEKIFNLSDHVDGLSWRSLISRFIRPTKDSYQFFNQIHHKETDYTKLINTGYLLGLALDPIQDKRGLKLELDKIEEFKKNLEKDEIFKKYFVGNKEVDIEITNHEDKINELRKILGSFEVSEAYYEMQKNADELKRSGQIIKNEVTLIRNSIKNIDKSIQIKIDIQPETIVNLYKEAQKNLPDKIVKNIEEVSNFHKTLIVRRRERLLANKIVLLKELKELETKREANAKEFDRVMKFLGKHKALDEFIAINEQLNSLNANLEKLKSYKGLLQEYKNKGEEIGIQLKKENIKASKYLDDIDPLLKENMGIFRAISKEFYDDKAGGFEVKVNDGKNQIRYNINVNIDDDVSDGVNEVKIFCFDMTVLMAKHNHLMNFILHDSRLFSHIDPRQISTLFRLANKYCSEKGIQYIATVNQSEIDPLKNNYYSDKEYKELIEKNIILKLTDDSNEAKLLGTEINLDYEK